MNDIVISVDRLNKKFNHKPAVIDFSLQVNRGDIFGFMGPNGSGKTTTIRMLCGLLTPNSGYGTCLGYDIVKQAQEIKTKIGYMSQQFSLYQDLTIEENLDFSAQLYAVTYRKQKIESVLQELHLIERRSQLTSTLSGGFKQRLALSTALLHEPELLLLDEPTAGIDPKARREFWNKIDVLSQKGVTTLVSTHYIDEALRCTRLVYISEGKLIAEGTSQAVINQIGLSI